MTSMNSQQLLDQLPSTSQAMLSKLSNGVDAKQSHDKEADGDILMSQQTFGNLDENVIKNAHLSTNIC